MVKKTPWTTVTHLASTPSQPLLLSQAVLKLLVSTGVKHNRGVMKSLPLSSDRPWAFQLAAMPDQYHMGECHMLTHTWKHQRTEQQGNSGTVSVGWVTTLQRHCRFVLNLPGDNCTCSTVILYRDSFPNPQQISQIHTMLFWDFSCEPHWTPPNLFSKCLLTGFCFSPQHACKLFLWKAIYIVSRH